MTITVQTSLISDLDNRDKECLRALYEAAGDYEDQRLQYNLPVEGTGYWASEDDCFTTWEEAESSGLLWLTANPACGKSVFANGYAKRIEGARSAALVCSYFFKQNSAHQALSALLHQILTKYPGAAYYAREEFAAKGSSFTSSTRTLWKIFRDICGKFMLPYTEILLVVDALDECEESSRYTLIQELLSTFSQDRVTESPRLKVLVTSRPTADLELAFRSSYNVARVKGEDKEGALFREIKRVILYRIEELGSQKMLKERNGDVLRFKLEYCADGSFLYVDEVFKLLAERGSYGESGIHDALKDAEQVLGRLYYEPVLSAMSRKSVGLFQCLLCANTAPTLSGINVALALRARIPFATDLERELEPDIEYTVKCLGGFLVRISNGKVDFVHNTLRQFLRERRDEGLWDEATCNLTMADRCLRFLTAPYRWTKEDSVAELLTKPPFKDFYRYATRNWYHHTMAAGAHDKFDPAHNESPEIRKLWESIRVLCDPGRGFLASWWPGFAFEKYKEKDKGVFTRQGSAWYFKTSESKESLREYLLHRAALLGNVSVLQALLASAPAQLSITDKNDDDDDVLCATVKNKDRLTVSWILRHFTDAPLQREGALSRALQRNDQLMVITLLFGDHTVLPNKHWPIPDVPTSTKGMEPGTLALLTNNLSFACLLGRAKLATELIRDGADVNQKSGGMSPLLAAVYSGEESLVKTLLDRGANPDELSSPEPGFLDPNREITINELDGQCGYMTQDGIDAFWQLIWRYLGSAALGITPLAAAAQARQITIGYSLRSTELGDNTGALAIRRAFPKCTPDTIPTVEAREIAMNNLSYLQNPEVLGRRICHVALEDENVEVLNELTGYGCLELPLGERRRTLLHVAAECGSVEGIEVFLREATHDTLWSRDTDGLTCLRVALRAGHGDVAVKIHEADRGLSRLTAERRTMLQDAVYGGVKKGVKVVDDVLSLIVNGALIGETVDARDGEGRTALHYVILATKEWEPSAVHTECFAVDVVRALVIGGAEYNLVDNQELTPLAFASKTVAEGRSADSRLDGRVLAALVELETTLTRVPFWGDNRLDAGAIRGNYEQLLKDKEEQDVEEGDDWMFESEEDFDDDDGEDEMEVDE